MAINNFSEIPKKHLVVNVNKIEDYQNIYFKENNNIQFLTRVSTEDLFHFLTHYSLLIQEIDLNGEQESDYLSSLGAKILNCFINKYDIQGLKVKINGEVFN